MGVQGEGWGAWRMGFREEDEDKERLWVQRLWGPGGNGMQGMMGTGRRLGCRAGGRKQTFLDPEH